MIGNTCKNSPGESKVVSLQDYRVTGRDQSTLNTRARTAKTRRGSTSTFSPTSTSDWCSQVLEKYFLSDAGIFRKSHPTNPAPPVQLTNFNFQITDFVRHHYDRNGTTRLEVKYVVSLSKDDIQSIPHDDYSSNLFSDISRHCPACLIYSRKAKDELKAIQAAVFAEAEKRLSVRDIYHYSGWECIDGSMEYLSAAKPYCQCDCNVSCVPAKDIQSAWKGGQDILDIGKKVYDAEGKVDFRKSYGIIIPLFLYLHMGFASKLFEDSGQAVQFILVIAGKSGSLKTSTVKALAEPFNEDGMLRFESTPRALELYRESCIDQTMIVDDIYYQGKRMMDKFEDLMRPFGDGIGRAKAKTGNSNSPERTVVRGGCIVISEEPLRMQQSSSLRCITLEFEPDSIEGKVLEYFQEANQEARCSGVPSCVQEYFAAWIQYLEDNYEEVVKFLKTFKPQELPLRFKRHERAYFIFAAIAKIVLQWGEESGAINHTESSKRYGLWLDIIADLMKKNEEMATTLEPWQIFIEALQSGIGTGKVALAADKREFLDNPKRFHGFKQISGDSHEVEYVLAHKEVIPLLRQQIRDYGRVINISSSQLLRELFEHGISLGYRNQADGEKSRNRPLKRIWLSSSSVEMLVIPANSLEDAVNEIYDTVA